MIPETHIAAAAKWWADTLRQPRKLDNGDAQSSAFGNFAASLSELPEPTQIDAFEAAIVEVVRELIAERGRPVAQIGCDYGPDHYLSKAITRSSMKWKGILPLPWKTNMWIHPTHVEVSCGYRAPFETICGTKPPVENDE